ncbi:hypothetical protein PAXRUDRAFT_625398 [Paxillus rubicundulus Ve08.2h10]|uniref:Uncharacterized protein n=1 Tax=Paxillus rubicundulus Ve08.2h10 TaxID=930991 RepID=A0A0D0E3F1_9AGAM|nr:hypothetical protein PAXRUDRAFT_625398 [Paxillus rubicundulus Ve08.2h10]
MLVDFLFYLFFCRGDARFALFVWIWAEAAAAAILPCGRWTGLMPLLSPLLATSHASSRLTSSRLAIIVYLRRVHIPLVVPLVPSGTISSTRPLPPLRHFPQPVLRKHPSSNFPSLGLCLTVHLYSQGFLGAFSDQVL